MTLEAGRRSRAMESKRRRISEAAGELFESQGFGSVTTQQISERADVAAGTLFRYAASKSELLLMVYNEKVRDALDEGRRRASGLDDPTDAIAAMVDPLVAHAAESPENAAAYQRELLFGSPTERFRQVGLSQIEEFEEEIAARLVGSGDRPGVVDDLDAARLASSSVFAVVHLAIARMNTGAHPGHDVRIDLRYQIAQILQGAAALGADGDTPGHPEGSQPPTVKGQGESE